VLAYAELYELELLAVIVDAGESAKSLDRPGLKRALGMLKAGDAEALLVVKLNRLMRSVVDLGTLVER
jgi:DNA invertase Pin-like site-specific DNA recombinase